MRTESLPSILVFSPSHMIKNLYSYEGDKNILSKDEEKILLLMGLIQNTSKRKIKALSLKHLQMNATTYDSSINRLMKDGWITDDPDLSLPNEHLIIRTQLWLTDKTIINIKATIKTNKGNKDE